MSSVPLLDLEGYENQLQEGPQDAKQGKAERKKDAEENEIGGHAKRRRMFGCPHFFYLDLAGNDDQQQEQSKVAEDGEKKGKKY